MIFRILYILGALAGAYLIMGCRTVVYLDGKPALDTYADISNLHLSAAKGRVEMSADRINHSKPTQTAFDGVAKDLTAGGAAWALFR